MKSARIKRPPDLSNATFTQRFAYFFASTFYTGSLPASGTWGALVAWALHVFLFPDAFTLENAWLGATIFLVVTAFGFWCSDVVEKMTGDKDDSRVTIDEVAGYYMAVLFVPAGLEYTIPAFCLARFFDIIKPPPANQLQNLRGGAGIMVDDLIASVYALICIHIYVAMGWGEAVRSILTPVSY